MKVLLVILDGLSDRPIPEFNLSTPLQAAITPNLDRLATFGANGLMYPIAPGIAPSTDLAHFVLLGYLPSDYPGRAVIEALGEERPLENHQVILRTSFISVEEKNGVFNIRGRGVPVTEDELESLVSLIEPAVIEDIKIRFVYSGKRQGFLFLDGADPFICDSDPFDSSLPVIAVQPLTETRDQEKAKKTADSLNRFLLEIHQKLESHPTNSQRKQRGLLPLNFLVTKWASQPGKLLALDSFVNRYDMRGALIAAGVLLKGLSQALATDFYSVEESAEPRESLEKRCLKAIDLLQSNYDFALVHTKAADEAAHTKNPLAKKRVIEELDAALTPLVKKEVFREILLVITADHSTPSVGTLIHSGEPVPLLVVGPGVRSDELNCFDEFSCIRGSLGFIYGRDLMPMILNYTDRAKYLGSRSFARDLPARPTSYRIVPLKKRTKD